MGLGGSRRRPSRRGADDEAHADEYTVTVRTPLGLCVNHSLGSVLLVTGISPGGSIAEWNRSAKDQSKVQFHDVIVEVNGVEGDAEAMRAKCTEAEGRLLVLRLRRISEEGLAHRTTFGKRCRALPSLSEETLALAA